MDDILRGTFERDLSGMDDATTSFEMNSLIKALQTPISRITGKPLKEMDANVTM